MELKIEIPNVPEEEMNQSVKLLMDQLSKCIQIIKLQSEQIQLLKDEIAKLKGNPPKPKIRPSKLENNDNKDKTSGENKRKSASRKRKKNKHLKITSEKKLHPINLPPGSVFKDYKNFIVQNIKFSINNILYRRGRWKLPNGDYITAPLPDEIQGHFGIKLQEYILHLNYELNVSHSKIKKSLNNFGIDISAGEINNILIHNKELFHQEKESILQTGLNLSEYIVTDDTGARHKGKNGYCNHIGNELFAYFKTTNSKSRINFLKILRMNNTDYYLSQEAYNYIENKGIPEKVLNRIKGAIGKKLENDESLNFFLRTVGIKKEKHIKIFTEGVLVGSILNHGFNENMVILSDEAGQFDVFLHALCWIHAERKINRIIPINDYQSQIIEDIRQNIWTFYGKLKDFKNNPLKKEKIKLSEEFDNIVNKKTEFDVINEALENLYQIKKNLLLVLERPEIPLNNNISENDIRIYVTKRKVHGGTRSDAGRKSRDTFISLNKTCKKLGISFADYLNDRLSGYNNIPQLSEIIRQKINFMTY